MKDLSASTKAGPPTLFIGIGAQKSGTTWLSDYFSNHPEVHMSLRKELHYWNTIRPPHERYPVSLRNRDVARLAITRGPLELMDMFGRPDARAEINRRVAYSRILRDRRSPYASYLDAILANYSGEPVAGEITPAYTVLSTDVFKEMASLSPAPKFLFLMRDPVKRLVSGVRQRLRGRIGGARLTADSVEAAVRQAVRDDKSRHMLRTRYDLTITQLEAAVSPDRIFYSFYEELFDQAEIGRLCRFLGVSEVPAETKKFVHKGKDAGGRTSAEFAQDIRTELAPVYDFVEKRFGRLPEAWHGTQAPPDKLVAAK